MAEFKEPSAVIPQESGFEKERMEKLEEITEDIFEELSFCEEETKPFIEKTYQSKIIESSSAITAADNPSASLESGIQALMNLKLMVYHQVDLERYSQKNRKRGQGTVTLPNLPQAQKDHLTFLARWQQHAANFFIGHTEYASPNGGPGEIHQQFEKTISNIISGGQDIESSQETLRKLGVPADDESIDHAFKAQYSGAIGAAATVDLLRLISTRELLWSDPEVDVKYKIDLFAETIDRESPSWAVQIKTDVNEQGSEILHGKQALKRATNQKEADELALFMKGVRQHNPEATPLVIHIDRTDSDIHGRTGKVKTEAFTSFKKQLDEAVKHT